MSDLFGNLVVSAGWTISLIAQSFVLNNTRANVFWVGAFIMLGDAFASLFQVLENIQNTQLAGLWSGISFFVRGTLRAITCGILTYGLKELGFFCFILLYLYFVLSMDFLLYDKWKDRPCIFVLIFFGFFILSSGCLVKFNGDFFHLVFVFTLICGTILANNFCDAVSTLQDNHPLSRVFEYFLSSIELGICGWFFFFGKPYVDFYYFWPLFPFFLILSGFCKSFYDVLLGKNTAPFIVFWVLIFSLVFFGVNFVFDHLCRGDVIAVFSGGILFVSALNSMKMTKPNLFFESPFSLILLKKRGELVATNVINFYIYNKNERRLAIFFVLTLIVMFIELFYGISANSLGMITDSFHMLLDSLSIAVGLAAAFAASLPCDKNKYPFGYAQYKILGGFINAVLLLFIALFVVLESIERLINPPEVKTAYLIHVSIVGLLVNVVGVVFFHNTHHHSHGGCSGCTDHNLKGVYLHILADLLGSVSVMLSSILMYFTKLKIFDPIFSFLSSILIFLSALPLLEETGKVLLLSNCSYDKEIFVSKALTGIQEVTGVIKIENFCIWSYSTIPNESVYCAVRLSTQHSADYNCIRRSIKNFLGGLLIAETGSHNATIIVHIE